MRKRKRRKPFRGVRGEKIIIVEDDTLLKDSLSLFFRSKGCEVSAFENAEAKQSGVDDFMLKPFTPDEIEASLLRLIRRRNTKASDVL